MAVKIAREFKRRLTFSLSPDVAMWVKAKARTSNLSRSALVERYLHKHYQEDREALLREGYEANYRISRDIARGSLSLQKKVLPKY